MGSNIAILGTKGGTGKTGVAINLAYHLKPKAIVDADIHTGISKILNLAENNPYKMIYPKSKQMMIKFMTENQGLLIDCGGFDSDITRAALTYADVIIIPSNDDPSEQFGLQNINSILVNESKNQGREIIGNILINKVHHSRNKFDGLENMVKDLTNLQILPLVIPFSSKVPQAQFTGDAVKSGTIAAKYSRLAKMLA